MFDFEPLMGNMDKIESIINRFTSAANGMKGAISKGAIQEFERMRQIITAEMKGIEFEMNGIMGNISKNQQDLLVDRYNMCQEMLREMLEYESELVKETSVKQAKQTSTKSAAKSTKKDDDIGDTMLKVAQEFADAFYNALQQKLRSLDVTGLNEGIRASRIALAADSIILSQQYRSYPESGGNTITQNITFEQTPKNPSEVAREIKSASRDILAVIS